MNFSHPLEEVKKLSESYKNGDISKDQYERIRNKLMDKYEKSIDSSNHFIESQPTHRNTGVSFNPLLSPILNGEDEGSQELDFKLELENLSKYSLNGKLKEKLDSVNKSVRDFLKPTIDLPSISIETETENVFHSIDQSEQLQSSINKEKDEKETTINGLMKTSNGEFECWESNSFNIETELNNTFTNLKGLEELSEDDFWSMVLQTPIPSGLYYPLPEDMQEQLRKPFFFSKSVMNTLIDNTHSNGLKSRASIVLQAYHMSVYKTLKIPWCIHRVYWSGANKRKIKQLGFIDFYCPWQGCGVFKRWCIFDGNIVKTTLKSEAKTPWKVIINFLLKEF